MHTHVFACEGLFPWSCMHAYSPTHRYASVLVSMCAHVHCARRFMCACTCLGTCAHMCVWVRGSGLCFPSGSPQCRPETVPAKHITSGTTSINRKDLASMQPSWNWGSNTFHLDLRAGGGSENSTPPLGYNFIFSIKCTT